MESENTLLGNIIMECFNKSKVFTNNDLSVNYYQLGVWLLELKDYRRMAKENKLIFDAMYKEDGK